MLLKTGFKLANLWRHPSSAAISNFLLNNTVMTQDRQILVTLEFLFTELKASVDIQRL